MERKDSVILYCSGFDLYCLGFDLSGGIVLIKSEIHITTPVVSRACWWPGGTGHFRTFLGGDVSLRPLAYTRAS